MMDKQALGNKIKQLEGLTNDEKSALLELLNSQKKYGLVWEDKPEEVEEQLREKIPILTEMKERAILNDTERDKHPNHILIEGDNLHALTSLCYTHEGKVDVIYIDPPYNTGNKDFVYNDSFVDSEDSFRHSKWLSFMERRLKLAKRLLSEEGVIFISIDDHEAAQLKLLCDEIIGKEKFVSNIIWQKKTGAADAKGIATITEYILLYCMNIERINDVFNKNNDAFDIKRYRYRDSYFEDRGPFYYDSLDRGSVRYSDSLNYGILAPDGSLIYPNGRTEFINDGWTWKWSQNKVIWGIQHKFIEITPSNSKKNGWGVKYKIYLNVDNEGNVMEKSIPFKNLISTILNADAAADLKEIFNSNIFKYSKPTALIGQFLKYIKSDSATILDFFAGSGTTLHATMQLNATDGGHRQCILVTNNENNICEEVTYERNKRVINGYTTPKGVEVKGLSDNNLRYYRTNFIERRQTQRNKRQLVVAATDLLCIKENIYAEQAQFGSLVLKSQEARYFAEKGKQMLILYKEEMIDDFVEQIERLNFEGKLKIYVFAPGEYPYTDDFEEVLDKVELCALPDAIYKAYKQVLPAMKEAVVETHAVETDELDNDHWEISE